MNKKLIALAVAGACVAPAAMAQTANPVTLYGLAYITLESVEARGSGGTSVPRRNRVTDQSSRIGIRGTEDLGGGLKAFFQLETGFAVDAVQSTYATRNSAVGLQGGWGSILAGRWDTPMKQVIGAIDPFADNQLGDLTAATLRQGGFDLRPDNVIQYWSPTIAGFGLKGMYVANEGKTTVQGTATSANPSMYGGSVTWAGGPAYVAVAYEKHKNFVGTTITPLVDEEGVDVGGTYQLGPLKLGAHYGEFKRSLTNKQKSYMAAAEWRIGLHGLIATFQSSKDGGSNVLVGGVAPAQPRCDVPSVGYKYYYSARTFLIASYTRVNNKTGALCNFGQAALAISGDQDPQGVSLGLRAAF
jgi:predicted porin